MENKKKALITGITGQDGSYLAEFLLEKGYQVHGIKEDRHLQHKRIDHIYQDPHTSDKNFFLHDGDLTDSLSITSIISDIKPQEIYNLAHNLMRRLFKNPEYTSEVDALGTLGFLKQLDF